MQASNRQLRGILLIVALLGPTFYLVGILARGVAILNVEYVRLVFTFVALAVSAAAAAFLAFRNGNSVIRIVAGAALLANLGSILYSGIVWWHATQSSMVEADRVPFEPAQIGILVSPADRSPAAEEEARAIEKALNGIVARNDLEPYVLVRYVYPLSSEDQVQRLGKRMRANVVVWKAGPSLGLGPGEYRVTVLGANETELALEPLNLMLLMAAEGTFAVKDVGLSGDVASSSVGTYVVAPLAAGLSFLAAGQPMQAAAQFQGALNVPGLPDEALVLLHNHFAAALLLLGRDDLALQEYNLSNEIQASADAWVGVGNVAIARHEWDHAADAFSKALILDPYDPAPYCGLGVVLGRQQQIDQALSSLKQAIAVAPRQSVPYALLGLTYELTADVESARAAYQRCVEYAGPNAGLHLAAAQRADDILRNPPTAVPTATPRPMPSSTPAPTSSIYTVEQGDTLQGIANHYGVSVQALVDLNHLDNPNALRVGQTILIPAKP